MSIYDQALKFSNELDDASIEELKAEIIQEDEEEDSFDENYSDYLEEEEYNRRMDDAYSNAIMCSDYSDYDDSCTLFGPSMLDLEIMSKHSSFEDDHFEKALIKHIDDYDLDDNSYEKLHEYDTEDWS